MKHRHLEVRPDTPVEERPLAAIADLLERGDLDDWRPILAAVARDPHGAFATRVLRLVEERPMYGTSALWRAWIDRCRARAEGPSAPVARLAGVRRAGNLTQVQLAERMDMTQSDLSKLERRSDVRVGTLRAWAAALGGGLRILFAGKHGRYELRLGREPRRDGLSTAGSARSLRGSSRGS